MAKKVANTPPQAEAQVGEIFSRSERFIETYKNHILIGAGAIIIIVVAILGLRKFYFLPMEKEAQAALFPGEDYFAAQEWDKALNGDSVSFTGFLGVIEDYGSTVSGKLANAYAGLCYYRLGQYDEAEKYLKKYSSAEKIFSPALKSSIGDCYAELGKADEAAKFFLEAAAQANDANLSPLYLKKAANAYEQGLKDYRKALDVYTQIKNKYPNSPEGNNIDKYIERSKLLIQK